MQYGFIPQLKREIKIAIKLTCVGDGEEVVTAGAVAAVETEVAAEEGCVGSGDWFSARGGLDSGDGLDGGGCGENCRTRIGGVPLDGC